MTHTRTHGFTTMSLFPEVVPHAALFCPSVVFADNLPTVCGGVVVMHQSHCMTHPAPFEYLF